METILWFEQALLPYGWAQAVRVELQGASIARVTPDAPPQGARHAIGIPALPNLHSHAFQHGFAGFTERNRGDDSFWSWREQMYRLVERMTPEDVTAIAAMAQVEMLETGFGRVGEFHYLHHQPDGAPYANPARMAEAIAEAAADTGIALTLLPVFYAHSDFGGKAPAPGQRRFLNDTAGFARLLEASRAAVAPLADAVVGIAPHSLRAVTEGELAELLRIAPAGPVHIHIAEQLREVEASIAFSGQRPVEWLLDRLPVDQRWCLVHATHVTPAELQGIAASGAVAGLCPITEANLGDGIFPAADFQALGGRFGIGSDSNVRIDASEELRLLEYGQRLSMRRRNLLAPHGESVGGTLFRAALAGGAQALGAPCPAIAQGAAADLVCLSADSLPASGDTLLDRWIFARGAGAIDSLWRGGKRLVHEGRHIARDRIAASYRATMARLL